MDCPLRCGRDTVTLRVPDSAIVYCSHFPEPEGAPGDIVAGALGAPLGGDDLAGRLGRRREGDVVVVVSDITRPVGYDRFLARMLGLIERAGVRRDEIVILVATGMHRASTPQERLDMFGRDVVREYRIVDHNAEDEDGLAMLSGTSWSGNAVRLNRTFVEAGSRILTGLVEPHFMAGFSGGRKAVCPGLASLDTLRRFHGYEFLSNPNARNANLDGNPCHEEAVSVAKLAGVDLTLNVVLDDRRRMVRAFAGGLEEAHAAACAFVRECSCPDVRTEADIVVTSSGGHPLDATFYQCVKGLVSCLPTIKRGGAILALGGCEEGVGGREFAAALGHYGARTDAFLEHIRTSGAFVKDQWQLQMHCRVLERVARDDMHFLTTGFDAASVKRLPLNGVHVTAAEIAGAAQEILDGFVAEGATVAVIPGGPYCAPV